MLKIIIEGLLGFLAFAAAFLLAIALVNLITAFLTFMLIG